MYEKAGTTCGRWLRESLNVVDQRAPPDIGIRKKRSDAEARHGEHSQGFRVLTGTHTLPVTARFEFAEATNLVVAVSERHC
jgi:hypothetical protein